jgi:hypothetical protein
MNARIRRHRVFPLETLEDRVTLSAAPGGPETAWPQTPAEQGRGAAWVHGLQGQDTGGPSSLRRQAGDRRRLDRAFVGFDRAVANLDRAVDGLERAGFANQEVPLRVFNRALTRALGAEAQLNRAFVTGATAVQEANRARLQGALDDLNRLNDRIEQVLQRLMDEPPSSGLGVDALGDGP